MTEGWGSQGYGAQQQHQQHQQPGAPEAPGAPGAPAAGPYGWAQPPMGPPQGQSPMAPPPMMRRAGSVVPLVLALGVAAAGVVLLMVGILALAAGPGGYRTMRMSSTSMAPTYPSGSNVTIKRIDGSEARRGDVVLFNARDWGIDNVFLERVIGVGGDHVVVGEDGAVSINGKTLREPYLFKSDTEFSLPADVMVPAGRVFLMGDHRVAAADSRAHLYKDGGTIARSSVEGLAVDPASIPSPDRRLMWAGAATAAVGLAGAVVAAVVRYRRTVYVPRV